MNCGLKFRIKQWEGVHLYSECLGFQQVELEGWLKLKQSRSWAWVSLQGSGLKVVGLKISSLCPMHECTGAQEEAPRLSWHSLKVRVKVTLPYCICQVSHYGQTRLKGSKIRFYLLRGREAENLQPSLFEKIYFRIWFHYLEHEHLYILQYQMVENGR